MAFIFKELFNQALITSIDNQLRFALSIPSQSGAYNITWENLKTLLGNLYNDVLSYDNLAAFPVTGNTNFIYIAKDSNLIYRWNGTGYTQIGGGDLSGYVPYTGATGDVDLGLNSLLSQSVILDVNNQISTIQKSELFWDADNNTVSIMLNDNVILQLGQENHLFILDKQGTDFTNGQALYIFGAQGNRPAAKLAQANSLLTSFISSLATEPITNNNSGYSTTYGIVRAYNTSGFAAGDKLYLSAANPGILTNVAPTGVNDFVVFVGIALNSTNNGSVFIYPQPPLANNISGNSGIIAPTQKAVKTDLDYKFSKNVNGEINVLNEPTFIDDGVVFLAENSSILDKIKVSFSLLKQNVYSYIASLAATITGFWKFSNHIQQDKGLYIYRSSTIGDTIGDTRWSNQSGIETHEYCTVANATKGAGTWAPYFKISIAGIPQIPKFTPAAEAVVTSSTTGVLSVANLLQNTLVGKGTLISGQCTITDASITTNSLALVTMSTVGVSTSVPIKYTASNGSMLFSTGQSTDTCDFTYEIIL